MIGGAPQRNGKLQGKKAREEVVKPVGVLQGEKTGEDILVAIVEVEGGLETDEFGGELPEGHHRLFELVPFGDIFGVVNGEEFSPGKKEPKIAGPGLGFG